jgi:hypothetical protein
MPELKEGYIEKLNKMEEENFQKNRAKYPQEFILLEDCEKIYRLLINGGIDLRKAPKEDQHLWESQVVITDIPNELCLATLSLFREHLDDSHYHLRKALELCGLAYLMSRSPTDAEKWKRAADDDETYKEFKNAFTTRRLFPKQDEGMHLLYEQYDSSSKYLHSSVFSVHSHLRTRGTGSRRMMQGGSFTADLPELFFKQHCVAIMFSHAIILSQIKPIFQKYISADVLSEFDIRLLVFHESAKKINDEVNAGFGIPDQG